MSFQADTAVTPISDGRFEATVHDGWDIAGNANGGYLMAMAVRAMLAASGRETPLSITAHYLRPGRPGPAHVDTEVVKTGKSFTTVRGQLVGEAGEILTLLGTFGSHTPDAPQHTDGTPPELPSFAACQPMPKGDMPMGFGDRVDIRFAPGETFLTGEKSQHAVLDGWFAFAGGGDAAIDPLGLLVAADSFPPVAFRLDLPMGWVPTLELTVHVRAQAAAGPLRCRFSTRYVCGGFLEEDGEVWDCEGRLVAQSRQLALLPRV